MNTVSQFSSKNDDPLVQKWTIETNVSCKTHFVHEIHDSVIRELKDLHFLRV